MVMHGSHVVMLICIAAFEEIMIDFLVHGSHVKGKRQVIILHFRILTTAYTTTTSSSSTKTSMTLLGML